LAVFRENLEHLTCVQCLKTTSKSDKRYANVNTKKTVKFDKGTKNKVKGVWAVFDGAK